MHAKLRALETQAQPTRNALQAARMAADVAQAQLHGYGASEAHQWAQIAAERGQRAWSAAAKQVSANGQSNVF